MPAELKHEDLGISDGDLQYQKYIRNSAKKLFPFYNENIIYTAYIFYL